MVQIDLLFKLAGLGVVVAVLCQVLTRAGREELSTLEKRLLNNCTP